jgi:hypothetical protein
VNNGVKICSQCAGVHRSLGVEYSFVQSLTLDESSADFKRLVSLNGSSKAINDTFLEFHVPPKYVKPNPNSSREIRESYINAKYKNRLFIPWLQSNERNPPIKDTSEVVSKDQSIGEIEFVGVLMINLISAKNLVKADFIGNYTLHCRCA